MTETEAIRMATEAKKMAATAGINAHEALRMGSINQVKIDDHERVCTERWDSMQYLQKSIFAVVVGVAGFLLVDKFFA